VRQRVLFKVATVVDQFLSGHAPGYLVDDCQLITDVHVRQLRSADTRTLAVNRTYSSFGDRTFTAAGTRVWNSLPPDKTLTYLQDLLTYLLTTGHLDQMNTNQSAVKDDETKTLMTPPHPSTARVTSSKIFTNLPAVSYSSLSDK